MRLVITSFFEMQKEIQKDMIQDKNIFKIYSYNVRMRQNVLRDVVIIKVGNIGFDRYISTLILRIYQLIFLHEYRYIKNKQKYFKIYKNTL